MSRTGTENSAPSYLIDKSQAPNKNYCLKSNWKVGPKAVGRKILATCIFNILWELNDIIIACFIIKSE